MNSPFTPIQAIQDEQREGWVTEAKPLESQLAAFTKKMEAVEKQQGEEIARLIQSATKAWEEADRAKSKIAELTQGIQDQQENADRLTAELAAQELVTKNNRDVINSALDAVNAPTHHPDIGAPARKPMMPHERITALAAQLATVTAERDRLLPRLISTAPTEADANNDGRVLLLGDGNSATFAAIASWGDVHSSWRRWLPLNLADYGVQTAQEAERERFEKAYRIEGLREQPEGAVFDNGVLARAENGDYLHWATRSTFRIWQAARAVKEGEG